MSGIKIKFFNLIREIVHSGQYDATAEYIPYGKNDSYPLELSKLVDESVVASSCRDTLADFIEGEGFSDQNISRETIDNRSGTFSEFHRKNAESCANFWGYAWLIKYDVMGNRTQTYSLSFENCRLGKPDATGYIGKIHYNPYFGVASQYQQKDTLCYDVYNPDPVVVKSQIEKAMKAKKEYLGQVLYFGTTRAMNRFYPEPSYESARYWMEVDKRIGEYHQKNLQNGFLQPIILKIVGNPNEPSSDPRYADEENKPVASEIFDREMAKEFSGSDRVGHIMTFWANNKEEFPEIQQFPGNNQEGYMTALVTQFKDLIATAWKIPPILANILSGAQLGGDGNVIRASVKLMQQRVVKWHHQLESDYKRVFGKDVKVLHYDPFPEQNTVDPQVWNALTAEEKRTWIKENTEIKIVPVVATVPTPALPQNKFDNVYYDTYPDKAKKNAKKAKDYQDQKGVVCQAKLGREITDKIINGQPLSMKEINRIKNFLSKHDEYKNATLEKCEAVNYLAWGGEDMFNWADEKIREVR